MTEPKQPLDGSMVPFINQMFFFLFADLYSQSSSCCTQTIENSGRSVGASLAETDFVYHLCSISDVDFHQPCKSYLFLLHNANCDLILTCVVVFASP